MITLSKKNIWGWLKVSVIQSIIKGWNPSGIQADMVLEKEPRVLHVDRQSAGRECDT